MLGRHAFFPVEARQCLPASLFNRRSRHIKTSHVAV